MNQTVGTDAPDAPAVLQRPFEHQTARILRECWDQMNVANEHFVLAIVGREGQGKSHTAIKLASLLDSRFTTDQVLFSPAELLELLRDEEYRRGGVYVLDEAGVSFGARTWQEKSQVKANQALQLIRSHNIGLVFTLPRLSELDSQTRGRLHAFYEITKKNPGEYVRGKWKWMYPDRTGKTGEIYQEYPRTKNGDIVQTIGFEPPTLALIEPYEEQKRAFQTEQYDAALGELEDDDDAGDLNPPDIAESILDSGSIDEYIREINNGAQTVLDKQELKNRWDIGRPKAKAVKSILLNELDREDIM
jgi:hypothetical protein